MLTNKPNPLTRMIADQQQISKAIKEGKGIETIKQ